LRYFWAHGGVDTLGLPLTNEYWEPTEGAGGRGCMVQYFQRARLEFDPETGLVTRSRLGELLDRAQPAAPPVPGLRYFPETGHNLGHGFLVFFEEAGGVEALGYPISEEVEEHGHAVQWFQNARLEWWPEHEPARQIQYGLLGAEHLQAAGRQVPLSARWPVIPLEPLREWSLPTPPRGPARALPPQMVPILYYHHVPAPAPLRDQIRAFREAGRSIVPLGQAVAALRGEAGLPPNPLALTFDDGWETQFQHAAPVLQAERVPATFFVITRYLGTLPGYMSWDQVRTLKELGHEVESHTQNHPDLDRLHAEDSGAAVAEIWESLAILEQRLGHSQRLFAYPNGRWDAPVADLVARVYRGAVATGGGALQSQDRLYTLRRIKAEPAYPPDQLIAQFG
jgi:peptidoglycan/xylan/chitin deacetylase (PgdA/CDA1 family)